MRRKLYGRLILLIINGFFFINPTYSQVITSYSNKNTELDYIRMLCYNDLSLVSTIMRIEDYCELLNNSEQIFKIDTLDSKGFKDVFFLKVSFQNPEIINNLYKNLEEKGNEIAKTQYLQGAEYFVYPFQSEYRYLFAVTPADIYKLEGFRINDFRKFYADIYITGDNFADEFIKENRGILSSKKIIKSLKVEGLDLWSLYRTNVKGKKK